MTSTGLCLDPLSRWSCPACLHGPWSGGLLAAPLLPLAAPPTPIPEKVPWQLDRYRYLFRCPSPRPLCARCSSTSRPAPGGQIHVHLGTGRYFRRCQVHHMGIFEAHQTPYLFICESINQNEIDMEAFIYFHFYYQTSTTYR